MQSYYINKRNYYLAEEIMKNYIHLSIKVVRQLDLLLPKQKDYLKKYIFARLKDDNGTNQMVKVKNSIKYLYLRNGSMIIILQILLRKHLL
jgi:hypothetical protein